MATLLAHNTLVDTVALGTPGCPNMSPSCCVLSDGTVLVSSVIDEGTSPYVDEKVYIWHLDQSATILGSPAVFSSLWHGYDAGLIALEDNKALLVATGIPYSASGDSIPDATFAHPIDATGETPIISSSITSGSPVLRFINTDGGRFSFYDSVNDYAVIHCFNGIAVYRASGAYVTSTTVGTTNFFYSGAHGWARHPTDPNKFAVQYRVSGSWQPYRQYTVFPDHLEVVNLPPAPSEFWWIFGVGTPYDAHTIPVLEATSDQGWQGHDRATDDPLFSEPGKPGWYQNTNGPAYASPGSLIAVGEYDSTDADGDWHPVVVEVTVSGFSASMVETDLDYYVSTPAVSLTYGSYTFDMGQGIMVLAASSFEQGSLPGQHFSVTMYILRAGAVLGRLKVYDDNHQWRTIGLTEPATDEGRFKVWTDDYGWTWEWFPSDGGDLRKWPLKVKTDTGWVTVAQMTNGEHL